MQIFASIALLALVAPIFAVPLDQLEARDDNNPSVVVFSNPTTEVPHNIPSGTLFPSQFRSAPSPTRHGAPEHTGAIEEGESRSGHPFPSGTDFPHHTHHTHTHTGTFKLHHPTGKPYEGFESFRAHHTGESHDEYETFKLHPTGEPHESHHPY